MKVIKKDILKTMINKCTSKNLFGKVVDGDALFVYYENKQLFFTTFLKRDSLWTSENIGKFLEEYNENSKLSYWSQMRVDRIRLLDYDWHTQRSKTEKQVFLLDGSIENFKKDFPYSPIDDYVSYVTLVNHYEQSIYRKKSANYMIINFIGSSITKPQIEKMWKTDFKKFVYEWMFDINNDMFRKAFVDGKNFAEITSMPNWMWKKLLEAGIDIGKWDILRIWNKQLLQESKKKAEAIKKDGGKVKDKDIHGFDEGTVDAILNLEINDDKTLRAIKRIINNAKDENGERLWSIKTLFNYLERVDMYQAIPCYSAIEILSDYIRMCSQMGVEPRIDSDSLKREHDIAARNYSLFMDAKREEFEQEKGNLFSERSKKLAKFEFEDDNYTAIVPKNITDLINEGRNNHNCVGSYVDMFAKGTSNIFFVRKKKSPEKSYITIELTGTCGGYKQAYLASNQRITDPEDWLFINKWLDNNKALA